MDRNQVVSLILLIVIVFGLMLDGARAFGGAMDADEEEEVQAPVESAPVPASSQRESHPALRHARRFA